MTNEIKACPHCGGKGVLNTDYSYNSRRYSVFVECSACGVRGVGYEIIRKSRRITGAKITEKARKSAIEVWNMRNEDKN